jgi:hypothetical protein
MIKKITTLVSTNKHEIIKKSVVVASVLGGLILGVMLARPDESVEISEIVDGEFTISEKKSDPED